MDHPSEEHHDQSQQPGFLSLLKPSKDYLFTPLLLYANIIVFVLMVIKSVHFMAPETADIIAWGGNFRPLILNGEWWRLFTSCFIHIGILHLVLNMYALVSIGSMLEGLIGSSRYILGYILTGLAGSAASVWWNGFTVSAGASGAIFGLFGIFFALLTSNLIQREARMPLLKNIGIFILLNLALGMRGGIDSAGHIGGLVSGILIGYIFYFALKRRTILSSALASILSVGVSVTLGWLLLSSLKNDVPTFEQKMEIVAQNEKRSEIIYSLPQTLPKSEVESRIKKDGIESWKQNTVILKEIQTLDLPAHVQERVSKLVRYSQLQERNFELILKAYSEETDKYNSEREKIESELKKINEEVSK